MPTHTVAEEFVYQLSEYGVKQIFGITGDAMNAFTDAIRRNGNIQWYTVRHEETAGFAVAAQAELSQELAVCVGTIGPGAIHLINGLYNATRDRSPVLAITGQVPRAEAQSDYFQEVDQVKAFDDACVFSAVVQSEKQIPRLIQQAIEAAVSERGVAHIAIPTDLAITKIEKNNPPIQVFHKDNACIIPSSAELASMKTLIESSKSPSILVGRGAIGAREEVHNLAKLLNAPVAHSLKGTEVLEYHDPYSIGGLGHVGTPHGMAVIDECDLLIMLGTDFPYSAFLPKHGNIIQVDLNAKKLGHRVRIKHGVVADVKTTLTMLLPQLSEKSDTTHLNKLQNSRDKWLQKTHKKYALEKGKIIHPQSVVLEVSKQAEEDAIFVGEVGEVTVWVARYLQIHSKQKLIGSFNHGSLGVGLAAALGAKARYPNKQVIALCGDGAFGMLLADLVTAARYNLNVVSIVFRNDKFGFVELEMEASGYPRFATDLVNPNFTQVANACGCLGIEVKKPEELSEALKQALSADKPAVVEVYVNPDELILPPQIDLETAWKFTTGKIKEVVIERKIQELFKPSK
ncbi:thiamine pyrophosphate-binding protein [Vibrio sp. S4M6]|uniref:thiamine pyrophosphate-dependent enzyme n=1 Tax=Vibrio sinus TaxID=2946865 RepID=UPI002029D7E9|nr:thiamine pyrophosphate-dependent enzyme [Vibrio sinus]MCL9781653.1 thiamine pyrophosphate-binding protein [Vibrio sinus]